MLLIWSYFNARVILTLVMLAQRKTTGLLHGRGRQRRTIWDWNGFLFHFLKILLRSELCVRMCLFVWGLVCVCVCTLAFKGALLLAHVSMCVRVHLVWWRLVRCRMNALRVTSDLLQCCRVAAQECLNVKVRSVSPSPLLCLQYCYWTESGCWSGIENTHFDFG